MEFLLELASPNRRKEEESMPSFLGDLQRQMPDASLWASWPPWLDEGQKKAITKNVSESTLPKIYIYILNQILNTLDIFRCFLQGFACGRVLKYFEMSWSYENFRTVQGVQSPNSVALSNQQAVCTRDTRNIGPQSVPLNNNLISV